MNKNVFVTLLVLAVGVRFFFLGDAIDDPHGWRQCDTANYIMDFYKNGIDFAHPAVCWMGGYKTLILEFPLPEAVIAGLYHIFGPYHLVARLFFLLSFLFSAYYFFKVVQLRFEKDLAMLATLVYLILPLSIFYSRALHIDFFAIGFALAMVYHFQFGITNKNWLHLWMGTLVTAIAFLVKAPYILVFGVVLIPTAVQKENLSYILKRAYHFLIPIVLFYLWTHFSNTTNGKAPDWSYISGYRKFDNNTLWYFGSLHQRTVGANWLVILTRIYEECIGGLFGLLLFIPGVFAIARSKDWKIYALILFALVLYVAVFFNLNLQHNYYQIPFICFTTLVIGNGIIFLSSFAQKFTSRVRIMLICILAIITISYCNKNYFIIPLDQIEIADVISSNTVENELIIVSYGGLSVHCPIILYRAHKNGWSIPNQFCTPKIAYQLYKEEKCRYLAFVTGDSLSGDMQGIYNFWWSKTVELTNGSRVHLLDFTRKTNGDPYEPAEFQ